MAISPNSIIHFTKEYMTLKKILTTGFRVKYCRERIQLADYTLEIFVPMISFCDIPLSQIKDHIYKYGKYGLGLSKEWATKNKLNPVLYIDKNSNIASSIKFTLENSAKIISDDDSFFKHSDIVRYIKNYQNDLMRSGKVINNYRFSDEREWRYVPDIDSEHKFIMAEHTNKNEIIDYNISAAKITLDINANDIKYIFVNNDSQIKDLISHIRQSYGSKQLLDDIEKLTTRIFTYQQLHEDV